MPINHYVYSKVHGIKEKEKNVEIFRFKNEFNDIYLLELYYYEYNVYAIKFYLKKHRLSPNRYSLCYPLKFKEKRGCPTGNRNFIKVMNTVIAVALEVLSKDSLASFGFLGAPKLSESDVRLNQENINPDNTICNTKRYKVYLSYCERLLNPDFFEYIYSNTSSILLLRNNGNKEKLTKEIAERYIVTKIIPNL